MARPPSRCCLGLEYKFDAARPFASGNKASCQAAIGNEALTSLSRERDPDNTRRSARPHDLGVLAFPDVTSSSFRRNKVELDGHRMPKKADLDKPARFARC